MQRDFGEIYRRTMNLSSGERALSIGIGLVLVGTGLWRSGASGALIGIAGGLIALRGLAGHCPVKAMVTGSNRREPAGAAPRGDIGAAPRGDVGTTGVYRAPSSQPAPLPGGSPKPMASKPATAIDRVLVGESLVGEGNEVAHVDLILGPAGSAAEKAFCHALTDNKNG